MSIKVAKFGGSSLADAAQFRKVKSIMEADPTRLFLVPSAPGKRSYKDEKITDLLFRCEKLASEGGHFEETFDIIAERYIEVAYELNLKIDIRAHLKEVWSNIKNGATADYAASRGEYLNALLLSDYLGFAFVDAAEVIRFDENGVFDEKETHALCHKFLHGRGRVVIPGFYGARPDGSIQVFPRGGSDISGAIIASGVHADVYENWTDVSGFLMADPRIVKGAVPIRTVTYSELRELAYMGATVLHEDSIFPVRQACIPINVRNTNEPEEPGTMIVPDSEGGASGGMLTGIAGRRGFTIIAIAKDNMHNEIGFGYNVLSVLKRNNISFEHIPTGIDTMSVVLADSEIEGRRKQIIDELFAETKADSIELHDNLALIATVGRGMVRYVGVSAKLFGALARAGVNIRMIDQGSSEMNIIVGVESDEFEDAVRAIYHAFKE
ncbi:aspartate kinase [Christensenellaceae bacterium OttesenSCG-928-L17]|nr:aspartate kinase [Christensenellaceae bacterium OttesenSCG-928-L17]